MGLNDHEQEILAAIERQFYEEDPELARAVRHVRRPARVGAKLSLLGVVAGLTVVIAFFTTSTVVAFLGFALLIASATALVTTLRARNWKDPGSDPGDERLDASGPAPFDTD